VGIHYDEQQLTVCVRDDGKGISPETLEAKGVLGTTACRGCANGRAKLVRNWSCWAARNPKRNGVKDSSSHSLPISTRLGELALVSALF
jgi:hypothetical protein